MGFCGCCCDETKRNDDDIDSNRIRSIAEEDIPTKLLMISVSQYL